MAQGSEAPSSMSDASHRQTSSSQPKVRIRDAASIILFDRSGSDLRVLVGKRSNKHAFMPDLFVFPGGRRDATDYRLPFSSDLTQETHAALAKTLPSRSSLASGRALALAAMRELQEETGISCVSASEGLGPDLSPLRLIARAITPPQQVRRFDTRFFSAFVDQLSLKDPKLCESRELTDIQWLPVGEKNSVNMPPITQLVLDDAIAAMTHSAQWDNETPVIQYTHRFKRFHRIIL